MIFVQSKYHKNHEDVHNYLFCIERDGWRGRARYPKPGHGYWGRTDKEEFFSNFRLELII